MHNVVDILHAANIRVGSVWSIIGHDHVSGKNGWITRTRFLAYAVGKPVQVSVRHRKDAIGETVKATVVVDGNLIATANHALDIEGVIVVP